MVTATRRGSLPPPTPPPPPSFITLILNDDEARTLRDIFAHCAGNPLTSRRGITDAIDDALNDVGAKVSKLPILDFTDGSSIHFKMSL